jgi:FkbM family methyltransferase
MILPEAVYVYGTGSFAKRLSAAYAKLGVKTISHLEIIGTENKDVPTVTPNSISESLRENSNVVIGIGNAYAEIKKISQTLIDLKYNVINPVLAAKQLFSNGIDFDNYWLTGDISLYETASQDINQARELLADKKSQDLFDSVISYRKTGDPFILRESDSVHELYSPKDLPWISKDERLVNVVDAGAYDGDTLKHFKELKYRITSWICLEPDPNNFKMLAINAEKSNSEIIINLPLAVWDKTQMLKMDTTESVNTSSAISENGQTTIPAISIDEMLSGSKTNLIKMDIEGAEFKALEGARNTIAKHTPYLAISTYHKPDHMWSLILLIQGINPKYKFYLRTYYEQTFETVLYGVPSED